MHFGKSASESHMSFLYDRTGKQNTAINYLQTRRPVKSFAWMSCIGNQLYKGSASFKSLKIKQRRHQFNISSFLPPPLHMRCKIGEKLGKSASIFFTNCPSCSYCCYCLVTESRWKYFQRITRIRFLVLSSPKYKTMFVNVWGEPALFDFSKENKVHINWSKSISTHIIWINVKEMVLKKYRSPYLQPCLGFMVSLWRPC